MTPAQRAAETTVVREQYDALCARTLALDMTRGKPCREQLDLANELLTCVGAAEVAAAASDVRNYGGLDGLPEAKRLFAEYLDAAPNEVVVGGNSSLTLMYDSLVRAWLFGEPGGPVPWGKLDRVRFLCPSPGYDRHFAICAALGIDMVPVAMGADGPDMDEVERRAADDPSIKGIWCVPRYSNPTGITYSADTVERLAAMSAAPDFRIYWDNAYAVHHLTDRPQPLLGILAACREAGNPDRPLLFGSTSKISFAGAGVAAMACSATNVANQLRAMSVQTIGPDKINQLRHVRYFRDMAGIEAHMKRHAAIIAPKFAAVAQGFDSQLAPAGVANLSRPQGGYFFSLDSIDGTAERIVDLAAAAGVVLTPAGSTFPYGRDPRDRNLRLAPSLPGLPEIEQAMTVICTSVRLACLEKLAN
jgi:aspartate/methionine/tyrosine aminotransferase